MRSKMTKFAVVVVILATIIVGVQVFDIQPDGSGIAFAEMIEAMNHQGWVYSYLDNGDNVSEWWVCLEDDIEIDKYNGKVTYTDLNECKSYIYDPQKNTISIEYAATLRSGLPINDPKAVKEALNRPQYHLKLLQQGIEHSGEKAVVSHGIYRGRDVQIQEYGKKEGSETEPQLILYIDPETKFLIGYIVWAYVGTGPDPANLRDIHLAKSEMSFDFPDPGPQSIYDVGVPRDAEVINRIDPEFIKIWQEYKDYRNKATEKQIAVITERFGTEGSASILKPDSTERMFTKLGWPGMLRTATIIEDDYSKESGLIGVEFFQVSDPSGIEDRVVRYLDPEKGYICHRQIFEWANGSTWIRKVTEYQQVDGLWYPAVVEVHSNDSKDDPVRLGITYRIYLDTQMAK
ncbi:MAG: hypothetical protein KAS23_14360 [Anaerohalosphaera sp.]|nr:hypothetical protein [Anaerohalosphaera sp.]